MYGGLVLAVLLSVTGFFYLRGVEREICARCRRGCASPP
jgi:hypothetical protein